MASAVQDHTLQLPSPPPERRRRTAVAIVVAVVAALAVDGLSVAALRPDTETVRSTAVPPTAVPPTTLAPTPTTLAPTPTTAAPTTAAPTTTAPPTSAVPAPERLTRDSRLRVDGLGPVKVGMTLDEASTAAGVAIRPVPGSSGGLDCSYARPAIGSDEVAFMVVGGRVVRVDIGRMGPDRVRTLSDIGKGSTEAEVLKTYAGRIRVEPHPYIAGAKNLVYVPADAGFRPYSMIFESVDGRVVAFRSGFAEQVSWTEGCS